MPAPTITQKWVTGFVLNDDGLPEVGGTVTAIISERIVRQGNNIVVEADLTLSTTTNGDGQWWLQLHPNNEPGDKPLNTFWTVTEPSGHSELLFIPHNASGGDTQGAALEYATYITLPEDLPAPSQSQLDDLAQQVSDLTTIVGLMNALDAAGLAALTPAQSTSLVDAALAASVEATSSTSGLLSSALFNVIDTLRTGQTNELANLVKKDANGIIFPANSRPGSTLATNAARAYVNTTSGEAELAVKDAVSGTNSFSILGPGFDAPAFQVSTDLSITSTTPQNITTTAIPVSANALYFVSGQVIYQAQGNYNVGLRFTTIPTGATLRWNAEGLATPDTVAGAGGVGKIDANTKTGNAEMLFPGQGSTTPVGVWVYGFLRTSTTAGAVNLQARQDIRTAGGTINPQILSGTALTFDRR